MKLRFLSRLLAVATLALLAVNARAYDFHSGGINCNVLSEEDRTVEVTISTTMYPYDGDMIIPEKVINGGKTYTVTSVGNRAFNHCYELTSIRFPASLTSIGNEAFEDCTQLTVVDLSGTSIACIGETAFSGCSKLASVVFPTSLETIGNKVFYECGSLADVKLPVSLTSIGSQAFYGCDKLTSVDLSSTSLVSVGWSAFEHCEALTYVKFPASLASIENSVFKDCDALMSVELPVSLKFIGSEVFADCASLTNVKFPDSLISIEDGAFRDCASLKNVDLSSTSLTSIGNTVFYGCSSLTSVKLPTSLTLIGNSAFSYCVLLSNLIVDKNNPAFTSYENVLYSRDLDTLVCYPTGQNTEAVISDMVRNVRPDAFPGKVSALYCQPQLPPEVVGGSTNFMFSDDELMNAVLYVPVGTKGAYMEVDPWRNFWNIEESDFATVGIDGVTAGAAPSVTVCGGKIVVDGASTTGVIEVFTADGRCAYRGTSTVIESLPKGAYVVRIGKFTQKVML